MNNQYNNSFGFNSNNNNNQYNQQMYNPYPNQYSNQYDDMNYQQPVNNNNNRRGGGFFSFLFALLLLIGLTVFLLDYTGKIDVKELYYKITKKESAKEKSKNEEEIKEEKKNEEVINYEEKVSALCSNLDSSGAYNDDIVSSIEENNLQSGSADNIDELWKVVENRGACQEGICMYFEPGDDHIFHTYDCNNKEYVKYTYDEVITEIKSNMILSSMCSNLDVEGNYTSQDGVCSNAVCTTKIMDKEFSKNCNE